MHFSREAPTSARGLAAVIFVTALVNGASAPAAPRGRRLWDEAGVLSSVDRATLVRRLDVAEDSLRSPLFLLLSHRPRLETVTAMADRVFSERGLGTTPEANPVLLLVAFPSRAAAIATGKGNAGIVPEIDASRITGVVAKNTASRGLRAALLEAIDAIVVSAAATAKRRHPVPFADDPDVGSVGSDVVDRTPIAAVGGPDDAAAKSAAGLSSENSAGADAGDSAGAGSRSPVGAPAPGRSRMPIAIALGVLIVFALGLRRRKQLTTARSDRAAAALGGAPKRDTHPTGRGGAPPQGPTGRRRP